MILILNVERCTILVGHSGYLAESRGANILLFGHTHNPMINRVGDIWIVNPGSLSRPRQTNGMPSYAVMDIDPEGSVNFDIKYLE